MVQTARIMQTKRMEWQEIDWKAAGFYVNRRQIRIIGDIKRCSNHISHEWMLKNIVADKRIMKQSLKSGYMDRKRLMIYDCHPELQSKWDKAFWAMGYHVPTIDDIAEEAIEKCIREQAKEFRKEDSRSTAL